MTQTRVNPTQQSTYHTLITSPIVTPSLDAARLFWVERNGELVRRAWEEMTATEKFFQNEADRRAADLAMFRMCDWEG